MLAKFRACYPQGSLVSELLNIDRGLYLVKVTVQVEGITLANGLAAADKLELAEDRARERAISALGLENNQAITAQPIAQNIVAESRSTPKIEQPVLEVATPTATGIKNGTQEIYNAQKGNNSSVNSVDNVVAPQISTPANEPKTITSEPVIPAIDAAISAPEKQDVEPDLNLGGASEPEQPVDDRVDRNQGTLFAGTYNSSSTESVADLPDISAASSQVNTVTETVEIDFNKIKHQTDIEIKRLGWTRDDGRNFLQSHYGKRSRLHLTDEELLEFLHYLENLPTPVNS